MVSAKTVVAKVYRDLDIRDTSWEVNAIEWIGECLRLLDTWVEFLAVEKELTVESYKTLLPQYYHSTIDVWRKDEDSGRYIPMVYSREDEESKIVDIPEDQRPWSYWTNIDTIVTTFESGTILLRYYRQCVDTEGYPLIPDSQNFKEAALWWIIYKLFMRKYQHPDPNVNLRFAYEMYEKYIAQARREISFPSIGELEEIVRNWTGVSVEETDYKIYGSTNTGNKVFPGFGFIDYGTGDHVNAINIPEYLCFNQHA
jgi:hypothetical protein